MPNSYPRHSIVFAEHNNKERVFPASTPQELSEACLIILRERYSNPIWGYKPKGPSLSEEEKDFMDFWEKDSYSLPALLYRQGIRIYNRLIENKEDETDPDWAWYSNVTQLLSLPPEVAVDYRVPYGGRLIPTSYYLLLKRRHYPNENFLIIEQLD